MKAFYLVLLLALSGMALAQGEQQISKQEFIEKVSNQNLSIQISEKAYQKSISDFNQTLSIFLPSITASHTGLVTNNPLMAFGSKLNQAIITQQDFTPSLLNEPESTTNFATRVEVTQPIFNADALYQRQASESKMQASGLFSKRTKEQMLFEMEKAYMQLQLAHKGVQVLEKALETAQENLQMAENSFSQGFLQKPDLIAIQVRVVEVKNQLNTAKSNVLNASNYLSFLMNEEQNTTFIPTDELTVDARDLSEKRQVPESRADLKMLSLSSTAYLNMHKSSKMSFVPRLNAFGSYELYDEEFMGMGASGYVVGVSLSWDLFKGMKRIHKNKASRAQYEQSQLQYLQKKSQSKLELNQHQRALEDSKLKLEMAQLAMEQSQEALRIRKNRFEKGLERTSDLLYSETQFAQKQLEYFQTIYQYNHNKASIEFLTKE